MRTQRSDFLLSREAASIFAQGDTYLVSVSYTGKKTGDGTTTGAAVGTFDAQQALIGRAAWLAWSDPAAKWVVEGHITDVLKLADATSSGAGPVATAIRLSNGPEIAVDASKTVDTGTLDARQAREFGFETAGTYDRFYGQAGWFRYEVERRLALPEDAVLDAELERLEHRDVDPLDHEERVGGHREA